MANGKFLIGKPSGGVTTVTIEDGATNTNLILPESGTVYNSIDVKNEISNGTNLVISPTGALGYGTGAGGTVTQLTSKSTAVTLNKPSGSIFTHNAALASGATAEFVLNNSLMLAETISVLHSYSSIYDIRWGIDTSGQVRFIIKNISASSQSHVIVIYFSIIKGAQS